MGRGGEGNGTEKRGKRSKDGLEGERGGEN